MLILKAIFSSIYCEMNFIISVVFLPFNQINIKNYVIMQFLERIFKDNV
ncbi:hypothetical protein HCMG_01144 [Helicobacter canadensis MIT 98-5491]|nr:hypothetical protein HCMG_01144 [Helicobacter canadensis MIT 98-5491]